ncbi:MAG TPA: signal peptidase I [Candidatus Dormibacteraeota bacterium]|nr:signal peptidase I [Candidatus Dormibacteraeota bacterium]
MGIARLALSAKPVARGYLDALLVAGLVALFLITFVIRTFYIPSVSMVPTLQIGDIVLVDEIAYRLHRPADGDVAIFIPPVDSGGTDFVKRVIGVPGDSIAISDGIVYRNGAALREPYENQPPSYELAIRDYGIYVDGRPLDRSAANVPPRSSWQDSDRIPLGYYLVLGDNRNYSDDSHIWGFAQTSGAFAAGPLAARKVRAHFIGRAFLTLWPLDRLRVLAK